MSTPRLRDGSPASARIFGLGVKELLVDRSRRLAGRRGEEEFGAGIFLDRLAALTGRDARQTGRKSRSARSLLGEGEAQIG